jgi:hypothetical protein
MQWTNRWYRTVDTAMRAGGAAAATEQLGEPETYDPGVVQYQPALSREESYRRVPHDARAQADAVCGGVTSWYAHAVPDQGALEHFAFGPTGFGRVLGQTDPGGNLRLEIASLAVSPATVLELTDAVRLSPPQPPAGTRPPNAPTRTPALDANARGRLGRFPPAVQRFLQAPFTSDRPVICESRGYQEWTAGGGVEYAWCFITDDRTLAYLHAERPMAEQAGTQWPELHAYRARALLPGWKRVSWNAGRAPA